MREKQLAICDKDEGYLEKVYAYLNRRKPAGYEIMMFNSISQIKEAISANSSGDAAIDILLIGESTCTEELSKLNIQKIFVLQENGLSGITEFNMIPKFQSMDNIIKNALEEFALDCECKSAKRRGCVPTKLITFYSPDRHEGKTAAAVCFCEILAELGSSVLYINLEALTGFRELTSENYDSDVTDFLYFALKHSDKVMYRLEGIKKTLYGVDFLPPANDFMDLMNITESEWDRVFDILLYSSDYMYVVIDLMESVHGFYNILDKSDQCYIPVRDRIESKAKLAQFKNNLRNREIGSALSNSRVFVLPEEYAANTDITKRLSVMPIGSYMRQIM